MVISILSFLYPLRANTVFCKIYYTLTVMLFCLLDGDYYDDVRVTWLTDRRSIRKLETNSDTALMRANNTKVAYCLFQSQTVTINFTVWPECMWMWVSSWELSGRLREGRPQIESRGAAASEGRWGLRDLHGGPSHLISCLALHLTHCCSHKRTQRINSIMLLFSFSL